MPKMRDGLIQRGDTWSFVIRVPDPVTGKTKPKWHSGFRTRAEAKAARDRARADLRHGAYVEPSRQTLVEFLDEWLPAIKSTVRPSTWQSYKDVIGHVTARIGGLRLAQITPAHLNTLYSELLDSGRRDGTGGLAPRTVRYTHTVLRKALGDAVRWGKLARNPADLADPPKPARTKFSTWSANDVAVFLAHVRADRLFAAYLVAATTGLRRGEILGLRWIDVDLDGGRLSVRQSLVTAGRYGNVQISEPKTARSTRQVTLDPGTVAKLRAHRAHQLKQRMAAGDLWIDSGLVFVREDGSPMHPQSLSGAFTRHARDAGLSPIRFHDLRHTYATLALQGGVHPKVVSERLGHSSIAITLDTYSHVTPSLQAEAADVVAGLITAAGASNQGAS
jgi:integrase